MADRRESTLGREIAVHLVACGWRPCRTPSVAGNQGAHTEIAAYFFSATPGPILAPATASQELAADAEVA